MSANVRVEFNHIPEIINSTPQVTEEALRAVGEFVKQKAHDRCAVKGGTSADGYYSSPWEPKDPSRAGEVRESIQMEARPSEAIVYSNHMISRLLEFGQGLGPPTSVSAKPFMRPAVDENRQEIVNIFGDGFAVKFRVMRS